MDVFLIFNFSEHVLCDDIMTVDRLNVLGVIYLMSHSMKVIGITDLNSIFVLVQYLSTTVGSLQLMFNISKTNSTQQLVTHFNFCIYLVSICQTK